MTPARTDREHLKNLLSENDARLLKHLWLASPSIHFAFRMGHVHIIKTADRSQWKVPDDDRESATKARVGFFTQNIPHCKIAANYLRYLQYLIVRDSPEEPWK